MFASHIVPEVGCVGLQQQPSSSSAAHATLHQESLQQHQRNLSGQLMPFPLSCSSSDPSCGSFMSYSAGPSACVPSLMMMKQESNSSSHTISSTSSGITRELLMELMPMRKKGKGGRQPAQDPRLDPDIDPKRAKRILANRQSAARSKLKQKVLMDGLRSRQNVLAVQREAVTQELCHLSHKCRELEQDNHLIRCRVQALADQYRLKNALTSKLATERDILAHASPAPSPSPPCSSPCAPCSSPSPPCSAGPCLTVPAASSQPAPAAAWPAQAAPSGSQGACCSTLQATPCVSDHSLADGPRAHQVGPIDARPQHGHCPRRGWQSCCKTGMQGLQ